MQDPQIIDSDYIVNDIDIPFKVVAGPGAGKTYWLARHVETVLKASKRLNSISLVACITYTNTGTEELLLELKNASDRIWVSTIHAYSGDAEPQFRRIGNRLSGTGNRT